MALTFAISLILGVLGGYIVKVVLFPQKRPALPPGPKPKFLIRNLLDLPKAEDLEYLHWLKHRDLYGPLSCVTIMGQTLIIINDTQLAFDLMEKRSLKHSSRPNQIFAGEMLGWENVVGLSPYSSRFRALRKHMAQCLSTKAAVSRFDLLQEVEVGHFLLWTLETPDNFMEHIRTEAGAVILKIAYGYTIEPHKSDPLVALAGKVMDEFEQAAVPGVWGGGYGAFLANLIDFTKKPYAFVKHQMAQGKHETSFLSQVLESRELNHEKAFVAKWSAMALYSDGANTTVSLMSYFFLAMIVFPEVQRKAQEEIDRNIGSDRLPGFQDRQNLLYIDAIVKEVLRWHPVGPMGLPHMTTKDDICKEYLIPKGAFLLPNIWFFTHDPDVYHNPMASKPERFLPRDRNLPEPDPNKLAFRFGGASASDTFLQNPLCISISRKPWQSFKLARLLRKVK